MRSLRIDTLLTLIALNATSLFVEAQGNRFGVTPEPTEKTYTSNADYQMIAEKLPWVPLDLMQRDPAAAVRKSLGSLKYDVIIDVKHGNAEPLFTVSLDGKAVYSWVDSPDRVTCISGDRLFYFGEKGVTAVDLTTGAELWKTSIIGAIGANTRASNSATVVNLQAWEGGQEVVEISGVQGGTRFVEFKDVKTGETVGHKLFMNDAATRPASR